MVEGDYRGLGLAPSMQICALCPSRRHLTLACRCFLNMLGDGMHQLLAGARRRPAA